jgi:hypothetical protein
MSLLVKMSMMVTNDAAVTSATARVQLHVSCNIRTDS